MARDGRGGLGLGDRLILLLAWITTCGLVYLLGFYVGKGAQERRLGLEERLVRLPVTAAPPAEGQRPKSENQFVFYDKLMGEHPAGAHEQSSAVAAAPHPAPLAAPAAPAPARPAAATASAGSRAAARAPATAPPVPPSRPSRAEVAEQPSQPPAPASPPLTPPGARPAGSGWTVLASPTRSRDEADGLTRQLRGRGYDATLVRVLRDGDTWYRVQVGRFATSEQATEVMHRLREHEGVSHAFVASE